MGHQKNYSWELKLQMAQLLETGEQNPSQISRDYHITRSLLYFWWQMYQEQGEAAFRPTQAVLSPPHVEQPQTAPDQIAHLERPCGQQAAEIDLLREKIDYIHLSQRVAFEKSCFTALVYLMSLSSTKIIILK